MEPTRAPGRTVWWLGAAAAAVVAAGLWVALTRPDDARAPETVAGQNPAAASAATSAVPAPPTAAGTAMVAPVTAPSPAAAPTAAATGLAPVPARATDTTSAESGAGAREAAALSPSPGDPPAPTAPPPSALSAKQLFARSDSTTGPAPGLRFRLTRLAADGVEGDVDPAATTFHSGDRVRFSFESNMDGFLYVVQQGSSGRWTVLFPGPAINGGKNAVGRGARYDVPSNDWFLFDDNPGTEQLFVFFSREPMQQLPGFDRPVTRHETLVASVVDDLRLSIRSRDLVFEKDRPATPGTGGVQATYVVNRAEVARAVSASISLVHAR